MLISDFNIFKRNFDFIAGNAFTEATEIERMLASQNEHGFRNDIDKISGFVQKALANKDSLDKTALRSFVKNLTYLDKIYTSRTKTEAPFHNELEKLKTALNPLQKVIEKPNEKEKEKPAPRTYSHETSSRKAPAQPTKTRTKKTEPKPSSALEISFRKGLESLRLDNPDFSSDIRELQKKLTKLKEEKKITGSEHFQLTKTLDLLKKNENYYKANYFEIETWNVISKHSKSFEKGVEAADTTLQTSERSGRVKLLQHLQSSSHLNLHQLAKSIPQKNKEIKNNLARERLEIIIGQIPHDSAFNGSFVDNALLLRSNLEKFAGTFEDKFAAYWNEKQEALGAITSALLKNYPYMHPILSLQQFTPVALTKYCLGLKLDHLTTFSPSDFEQKVIQPLNERAGKNTPGLCTSMYANYFKKKIDWFASHVSALKQAYNQAEHGDRNQGKGTCFQNSLDRYCLLISNPTMEGEKIPMGSSAKGRVVNGVLSANLSEAVKGNISRSTFHQKQHASSEQLGLKLKNPPNNYNSAQEFLAAMDSSNKDFFCILGMSGDGGHAINIQINQKTKTFRIIDDNIGVLDWGSYKELREAFTNYLAVFYPRMNHFETMFYNLI